MAIRVELDKTEGKRIIEAAIASLKRSAAKDQNPMMKKIIEDDIAKFQNALNTITEIK